MQLPPYEPMREAAMFAPERSAYLYFGEIRGGQRRLDVAYKIIETCIGCTACTKRCPTEAITGTRNEIHQIDPDLCIDCGACVPVCPVSAIFALDDLPEKWNEFTEKNAAYYKR